LNLSNNITSASAKFSGLITYSTGCKIYYVNDKLHREDGPAVERADGCKGYWIHGKRHREDGPAIEWENRKYYYLNNLQYSEQNYWEEIKRRKSLGFILSNIKRNHQNEKWINY
jgi:hypothetical protein